MNIQKLSLVDFGNLESTATPTLPSATFGSIITRVLEFVFPIAGFVTLAYLIYGGYLYLTSSGDPKAIQSSMKAITYAVVGFLVLLSSFIIMNAIGVTLRLPILQDTF